jgi:hypothetical protein
VLGGPVGRFRAHVAANRAIWLVFAVTALWIGWFATRIHVYFVMPDELRYVKQAVAWGSGQPVVPGTERFTTWSQAQPLLMAPLWSALPTWSAYRATHVLNALVFASAVFPAFLLARRVLASRGWAIVAAVLTVVVPWTVLAGVMMTEVVAYPLVVWAVYAVQLAVVRPSARADLWALAALAASFLARTQLIVLAAALPVGLLAQGLRYPARPDASVARRLRDVLAGHRLLTALVVLVGLVLLARPQTFLGDAPGAAFRPGSLAYAREMLAYIGVGVAMVPLTLGVAWVAATVVRPLDAERHAYAVILLTAGVLLTVVVGGGSVIFAAGLENPLEAVNDRYLCFLAPLMMIGMLALLTERRPLTAVTVLAGAAATWVAWGSQLRMVGQTFVSPSAAWHLVLNNELAPRSGRLFGDPDLTSPHFMAWLTAATTAVIVLARRWLRPALTAGAVVALVGGWCLAETTYTRHKLEEIQPASDYGRGRDWVDRTLGAGQSATVLLSSLNADPASAQAVWWDVAFWNRQVTSTRYLALPDGPTWPDQAFAKPFVVDPATGVVTGLQDARFVVHGVGDRRFGFRGAATVGTASGNLEILSLPAPVQATWAFRGSTESGFVPAGERAIVRVFGDGRAATRRLEIALGPSLQATASARYRLTPPGSAPQAGTIALATVTWTPIRLDLPASGHVDVEVSAPTGGGSSGVQFYAVRTRA